MATTPGVGMTPAQIEAEISAGRLQPQWSQVAIGDDGSIIGRALWWGRNEQTPIALDVWDAVTGHDEPGTILVALLKSGHDALTAQGLTVPLPHTLRVPVAWRAIADAEHDVRTKIAAAAAAGLEQVNERKQFQWDHGSPVPAPGPRLRFEQANDDTFVTLFARAAHGSLDIMTRRELATTDAATLARDEVDYTGHAPGTAPGGTSPTTTTGTPSGPPSPPPPPRTGTSATSPSCPSTADTDTSTTSSASSPHSTPRREPSGSPPPPTP